MREPGDARPPGGAAEQSEALPRRDSGRRGATARAASARTATARAASARTATARAAAAGGATARTASAGSATARTVSAGSAVTGTTSARTAIARTVSAGSATARAASAGGATPGGSVDTSVAAGASAADGAAIGTGAATRANPRAAAGPGGSLPGDSKQRGPGPPVPPAVLIAVDAMGGDHAPAEIVAGAVTAARASGLRILLTGRPGLLRPLLAEHGALDEIRIVPADEALSMGEGALASWRRPRSSIAVACQLVRRGQAAAVVSAGSTAGIVATARLRLRPLPGVARPALAVVLPTRPRPTLLLDAGAIADPKPEMLVQFAQLGVAYAQVGYAIFQPRVGLLTIGAEPGKGNKLARRAHELLDSAPQHGAQQINFVGNVEGSDLLTGQVDVIVTDGFTGNVALKTLEGTAAFAGRQIQDALRGSASARVGTLFQRRALRELKNRLDAEGYGGAALLGLEGTVVIAHGAATARTAAAACDLAAALATGQITERIRERLGSQRGHFLRRP
jgi:phosphate acyltransferase